MTTLERVAYLKGLADGMNIDDSTNEGKLLLAIVDVLEDIASDLADACDDLIEMEEVVDELNEDLEDLEEMIYDDEDDDEDSDEDDFDDTLYEVECPSCGDVICLDEGMIEEGGIDCPNCGEKLEFEFEDEDCSCEECNSDCE